MKKIRNPYQGCEDQGYNCFACCPSNPFGLKMEFFEDGDDIVCIWESRDDYQSWIKTLHGGIQATLLDEAGGWVISRKLQTTGMTSHLNVKYRQPAPTGEGVKLEIRARLKQQRRNLAFIEAEITHEGKVCSSADMIYYCFPKDKAKSDFAFNGCRLEEE
jgi:acyl-coenzyme A thioesterase PaaI-like protein